MSHTDDWFNKRLRRQHGTFTGSHDELDALIEWKKDWLLKRKGADMQREFTIQLRVDFADEEKLPHLQKTLKQCARHALATARLISDNPKATQIVAYSDDFYSGHQEIAIMEDDIQTGLDQVGAPSEVDEVSSELMAAVTNG